MMPSSKLSNYIFKNNQDLTFENVTKNWGMDAKVNSNGAVYADLDNDGDLDIIVNNQAEKAAIYKNNSTNNFSTFSLEESKKNTFGIGAKVTVFSGTLQQSKQLFLSRGFQSSISTKLHFGLGNHTRIDSVIVDWGDHKIQKLINIKANKNTKISYRNAKNKPTLINTEASLFETVNPSEIGINYKQKENAFDDYKLNYYYHRNNLK